MILMKKGSELCTDLRRFFLSDTATGSPVIEIGYNQFLSIAVPEKVDMATCQ